MTQIIPFILNAMAIGLIAMMIIQGLTRRVEMLSYRNIYLVGFIMFQLFSGATVIAMTYYDVVPIERPKEAANLFLIYAVIYLIVYLFSHHKLRLVDPMVRWFKPKQTIDASDWALLLVGIGFTVLAVFMKYVGAHLPVLSLVGHLAPLAAVPCCLVGWVWGGRRFNFVVVATGGILVAVCLFLTVHGVPSRRYLLGACLGLAWGAWYRKSHQVKPLKLIAWALPVVLAMGIFVGAWTSVRHVIFQGESAEQAIAALRRSTVSSSMKGLKQRSLEAGYTLWALDAYPDRHERRHLFTFKYMLYHPIPRRLWDDKPKTLSNQVAHLVQMEGVDREIITLTPCVLGHAHAEGGLYALVLYALFFGQLTRFFDTLVRSNHGNPFIVIATGCTLGQVVALARGDLSVFSNFVVFGFLIVWTLLLLSRVIIGRNAPTSAPVMVPQRY